MKTSQDRILTTHVGSLPRSKQVTDLVFAHEAGEEIDQSEFARTISAAVAETIRKQRDARVDVVSDGEMSKISYATYIKDRITGFDGDSPRRAQQTWKSSLAFSPGRRKVAERRPIAAPNVSVRLKSKAWNRWKLTSETSPARLMARGIPTVS